jgi:hypothetical protein
MGSDYELLVDFTDVFIDEFKLFKKIVALGFIPFNLIKLSGYVTDMLALVDIHLIVYKKVVEKAVPHLKAD